MTKIIEKDLVYKINGCVYEVYRELGAGFLEKIYERALILELKAVGLKVEQQLQVPVFYKGQSIGDYIADIIVENKIIIELKAQEFLHPAHEAQLLNYLKITKLKVGLLVNFTHPKATIKRMVL